MKKNSIFKKAVTAIFAATLSITAISGLSMTDDNRVYASTSSADSIADEVENATAVTAGTKVTGYINGEGDVDYYKFTTDGKERFYFLEVSNLDEWDTLYYKVYSDVDCMDKDKLVDEGVSQKNTRYVNFKKLEKNHTYYIKIESSTISVDRKYSFILTTKEDAEADTVENATAAAVGEGVSGQLESEHDVDWFKFTTDSTDSFYWFTTENLSADYELGYAIYSGTECTREQLVAEDNWGVDKKSSDTNFLDKLEKNHTYYVKFDTEGGQNGIYNFKVTKKADNEPDTVAKAKKFTVGKAVSEKLEAESDVDWYKFTTDDSDSFYWFSISNLSEDYELGYAIYSGKECTREQLIAEDSWGVDKKSSYTHFLDKLEKKHTYYVKLETNGGENGSYRFKVTKKEDNEPDTVTKAKKFTVGKSVSEKLEAKSDVDWFKFTTDNSSDSYYWITVYNLGSKYELDYAVYSGKECTRDQLVAEDSWGVDAKSNQKDLMGKLEKKHTYYVKLSTSGENGSYKFVVTKKADDVKDTVTKAKTISLNKSYSYSLQAETDVDFFKFKTSSFKNYTLTFSNVSGDGYIYYTIYSGKDCLNSQIVKSGYYNKKQSVTGNAKKISLKADKTYYVKINGVSGSYKLGISANAPESLKVVKAGTKKVAISWGKLSQATGYEVYRATSRDGKYTRVKTISKNSTVKYVDSSVKKGKTYFYKVRAYKVKNGKKVYSDYSSIKSIKVK